MSRNDVIFVTEDDEGWLVWYDFYGTDFAGIDNSSILESLEDALLFARDLYICKGAPEYGVQFVEIG